MLIGFSNHMRWKKLTTKLCVHDRNTKGQKIEHVAILCLEIVIVVYLLTRTLLVTAAVWKLWQFKISGIKNKMNKLENSAG